MGLPNTTGAVIASGYNCFLRDGKSKQAIAFIASFQATEDFQVQDAVVIGHLGPIVVDPQGYTCSITMDGFLAAKGKIGDGGPQYEAGGNSFATSINDIPEVQNSTRVGFMDEGAMHRIETLEFFNRKSGKVLATFIGCILTSYGISADGNAYVRNNVQMRALDMIKPGKEK